jgi:hypothetical protein
MLDEVVGDHYSDDDDDDSDDDRIEVPISMLVPNDNDDVILAKMKAEVSLRKCDQW